MASRINRRESLITLATVGASAALAIPALARRRTVPSVFEILGDSGLTAAGELTLPKLPYQMNSLEPHIDAETMEIHHDRHHKAYVDNANKVLATTTLQGMAPEKILAALDTAPDDKRAAIRNNVGGHVNHSMFWLLMAASGRGGGGEPTGPLADAIKSSFGSFGDKDGFKDKLAAAGATRFGSGWAWLCVKDGKLAICSTPNQDTPLMGEKIAGCGGTPILGLDVWEHAYYLKYRNKRADYITAWWNVVNWGKVAELYSSVKG